MALIVPGQGEQIALEALLNKTAPQDLDLRLYKNDVDPGENDTEDDYVQADFTGYAAKQLNAANWTVTPGAPTSATYPEQVFTSVAPAQSQNVYGYYVVQRTSGKLVWAERFADGPYTIVNNGDQIKVTPNFTAE